MWTFCILINLASDIRPCFAVRFLQGRVMSWLSLRRWRRFCLNRSPWSNTTLALAKAIAATF
jgi:hypothetical protein